MTQTAQTVIEIASSFSKWCQNHMTVGGELIRQFVPLGMAFGLFHFTPEQQSVLFSSVSGIIAAITVGNVVSKVRVGERITEGVQKEVEKMSGTGDGTQQPKP